MFNLKLANNFPLQNKYRKRFFIVDLSGAGLNTRGRYDYILRTIEDNEQKKEKHPYPVLFAPTKEFLTFRSFQRARATLQRLQIHGEIQNQRFLV